MSYDINIEKATLNNKNYRKVLNTTPTQQLVLMSLKPGVEIGNEKHTKTTQFIRIESGKGLAIINGKKIKLQDGSVVVVKPNTYHNIINTSKTRRLQLYTIYSPPEHKDGLVQKNKP